MSGEESYVELVESIIETGNDREDRIGTGTLSTFGAQMRFDLSGNSIPLITTKRMYWKAIVHELLWFISGSTDSKKLSDVGVSILKRNGTRDFLDNLRFYDREIGDLGPVYGFQWRHFGAKYIECNTDYAGNKFDQLANCIQKIKTDPTSRRIVMSA